MPRMLWWGRFDPDYSRNRVLRQLLLDSDWELIDFRPRISALAALEARLRGLSADVVWVPCFRQRDIRAASRWARSKGVPLIIDPLISAYDKQVDERKKLAAGSPEANKLLTEERALFALADRVLADTPAHAAYFADTLQVDPGRIGVVHVGAEGGMFQPAPLPQRAPDEPLEVLFYGSFIPLQGAETIVEAARLYDGPPVVWTLLGEGPLKAGVEQAASGLSNVRFEGWIDYRKLPERVHQADILLGVFGSTPKARRVIPNKVFQAIASGRPTVTASVEAYPVDLVAQEEPGLRWVGNGDARALADAVAELAADRSALRHIGASAAASSHYWFSSERLAEELRHQLDALPIGVRA